MKRKPSTIRPISDQRILEALDRAQRISQGDLNLAVAEAVAELRSALDLDELVEAVRIGSNAEELMVGEAWDAFETRLARELTLGDDALEILRNGKLSDLADAADGRVLRSYFSGSRAAVTHSPIDVQRVPLKKFLDDRMRTKAIEWLDTHGAAKVTNITDSTKDSLRVIISRASQEGSDVKRIERLLVSLGDDVKGPRLGLHRHQQELFEKLIDETVDVPAFERGRILHQDWQRKMRRRGRLIARTETLTAANEGASDAYKEAVAEDMIDADLYLLEWVTRVIKVCKRCQAMDGATRELTGGVFTSDGSTGKTETTENPDLHPGGYCGTRTIRRADALRKPGESALPAAA